MQKHAIQLILFLIGFSSAQAQGYAISAGGSASGSGGSISYSVGQVFYKTNEATNGSEAQGIQQPLEISIVSGVVENFDIALNCSAYPNPAVNILTLKVDCRDFSNISYSLFDINGRVIQKDILDSNETSIYVGKLLPAVYFLKITKGNNEVKTFKIVKTN